LPKRYSNLKNLINDRSSQNTVFIEKVLKVKNSIKIKEENLLSKIRKKTRENIVFNVKLLKLWKLWVKFSRKQHFKRNFDNLREKTFFTSEFLVKDLKVLLEEMNKLQRIPSFVEKIDLNEKNFLDMKRKLIPLIKNDLNEIIFSFLSRLKTIFNNHNKNEIKIQKDKSIERFLKKRTYSLCLTRMPNVKVIKREGDDKALIRKFVLYSISRFIEEIYQLNLENSMILIEVFDFY